MKLPYVDHGNPEGTPLLLLHGYTDSWRSWEPVLAHLPEGLRAIVPTQRGHGDAERPESGYRIEDLAADTVEVMDELDLGPAIVVGHSMGAWIAQRIAFTHPERVAAVVLEAAIGPARDNPAAAGFGEEVAQLSDPVPPAFAREFQESTCARPPVPGMLDTAVSESLKMPARIWRELFAGFLELDHSQALGAIAAPTLLIWGGCDAFATRAEQDKLVSSIPDARLEVYEGAGHAVHWEDPEGVAASLAAFAASLPQPAAAAA